VLRIYDLYVLGFSCSLIWKCPAARLLRLYEEHVGRHHLDVGVGTGYYLKRARFRIGAPEITLFDLNPNSLEHAARRIAHYQPKTVEGDILEPNHLPRRYYDSISLNFLLHCLPDGGAGKWRLFDHLIPTLAEDGLVFGSTLLGRDLPLLRRQRLFMTVYNGKGIFSNQHDSPERLQAELQRRFQRVHIEQVGAGALFVASGPR